VSGLALFLLVILVSGVLLFPKSEAGSSLARRPPAEEKNATFFWRAAGSWLMAEGGLQSSSCACNSMFALQCLSASWRLPVLWKKKTQLMVTKFPQQTDADISSIEVRTLSGAAYVQNVVATKLQTLQTHARQVAFLFFRRGLPFREQPETKRRSERTSERPTWFVVFLWVFRFLLVFLVSGALLC
jgi:hypothetical protein